MLNKKNKKFLSFKDLLKENKSEIVEKFEKSGKYVKFDFQDFGYRLAISLNDLKHRSLYMKFAKTYPENTLQAALSFALDYPLKYGTNRAKIFMWKLKEIKNDKLRIKNNGNESVNKVISQKQILTPTEKPKAKKSDFS